MEEKYLTPYEIADKLQFSREYVYRLLNKTLKDGGIPSLKIGNTRRIKESDLNSWLEDKYEEN